MVASSTKPSFTGHNIRLDDGTYTIEPAPSSIDEHPVTLAAKRLLHALYSDGLKGKTLIDVGCLEGGFTTAFARMGMMATGLEVRDSNIAACRYVRDHVDLPNLQFIQGDANDIAKFGDFDVFFVSGLLYHLDRPRRFLQDVASHCRKALFLWTHITHAEQTEASQHYTLSGLTENEGLHGRWYADHGDIPLDELNRLIWASWANKKSFWIQKEYLLHVLRDLGFDLVLEQFDYVDDIVGHFTGDYAKFDRVVIAAIKSGLPVEHKASSLDVSRTLVDLGLSAAPEAKLAAAERELAVMRSSLSWRATAPLRRLRRLFETRLPVAS